jgi:phospholipid/cholesterol/gamma-HCH transport system substrate-binding protein
METKANHLVIGAFVLAVLVSGFGFIYWLQNMGSGGGSKEYAIVFEGGVSGISSSSKVLFNGIKVGNVVDLELDPSDARQVRVLVTVSGNTPVRTNSRARIESQGLTGGSAIQITPGTPDTPLLVAKSEIEIPVIKADRASSQSLFDAAPEVMGNANALLVRMNDILADNQSSIRNTITNVESFTGMLDARKDDIDAVIRDAKALSEQIKRISDKIENSVDNFSKYMTDDGQSFLAQAQEAAQSFKKLAEKLDKSFGDSADGMTRFAKDGLKEFELFMRDGRRAAHTLERVLEQVERNPQSFLFGGSTVPEYTPAQ